MMAALLTFVIFLTVCKQTIAAGSMAFVTCFSGANEKKKNVFQTMEPIFFFFLFRFDLQFSSVLFSLLDRISQVGHDKYNEKVSRQRLWVCNFTVLCAMCTMLCSLCCVQAELLVQCAVCIVHSVAYTVLCAMYTVLCVLCTVLCAMYTVLCVLRTVLCAMYTQCYVHYCVLCAFCIVFCAL